MGVLRRTAVASVLVVERDGHKVSIAADGRAGLAVLAAGGIDLLVVDIFMPGMDGLDTLREVRRHQADLPVIVMSVASLGGPARPLRADTGFRKRSCPKQVQRIAARNDT